MGVVRTEAELEAQLRTFDVDVCDACEEIFRVDERDQHPCVSFVNRTDYAAIAEELRERTKRIWLAGMHCARILVGPDLYEHLGNELDEDDPVEQRQRTPGRPPAHYMAWLHGPNVVDHWRGVAECVVALTWECRIYRRPALPPGWVRLVVEELRVHRKRGER